MDDETPCGCTQNDDVLHGDFAMFVKAHLGSFLYPVALRYAGFRGLPQVAAADIVQEALLRAYGKWCQAGLVSSGCGKRLAYVCTAMSLIAQEELRKQIRAGTVIDPSEVPDAAASGCGVEDRVLGRAALRALVPALASLDDQEHVIIDLRLAGVPDQEIAAQLGTSVSNVRVKLHRVRKRLAECIGRNQSGGAA